jgi:4-hydroxybenzoate polyprenyltransferase
MNAGRVAGGPPPGRAAGGASIDHAAGSPAIVSDERVADSTGNWVDRLAPLRLRPYLRLARLDRPIGSWLLLMPCWWSAGLAAVYAHEPYPNPWHMMLFFVGAFAMRGAGCTWNDIVDRDIDAKVERTRSRPIPSGQVGVRHALAFLVLQALIGLTVLLQFNWFTILVGIASLGVVVIYPFMKRITYWPQIVLGLAFSWGALMGWPALLARLDWPPLVLYAGAIAWVIGYDTIYAHQDREDDALIGLKSTAILFGDRTRPILAAFYAAAVVLLGIAGFGAGGGAVFAGGLLIFAFHLAWQVRRLDIHDPDLCLVLFKANREAGLILFGGFALDAWVSSWT